MLRTIVDTLLALWVIALAIPSGAMAAEATVRFPASDAVLDNPYIGNAVWATTNKSFAQPFSLVYASVTWAQIEPERGVYDFETFERENQFEMWRAQGKHCILRLMLDQPSTQRHMDIPDWLFELTKDGKRYNVSYGRGYSPNYANETLIQEHEALLTALAQRYDDDPFVAYVQLGSVGHWGEWHVHDLLGGMPPDDVRLEYAQQYARLFRNTFLMMRRPFAVAAQNGMGLYNDTAGKPGSTGTWLQWIEEGGAYEGEPDMLVPMPDAWKTAPIGGELATSLEDEEFFGDNFAITRMLFAQSHTSWIGPGSFAGAGERFAYQEELDKLMREIGYRLRVESMTVSSDDGHTVSVSLTFVNDGNAPFYFDWIPALNLRDDTGYALRLPLDLSLAAILPDEPQTVTVVVDMDAFRDQSCDITVCILDPDTLEPGVALAMDVPEDEGEYRLGTLSVPKE